MRWFLASMAACGVMAVAGCGGGAANGGGTVRTATSGGFVITISNLAYSPLSLAVPPGATVTVVNNDGMPHSLTSESAPGRFTPGAVGGIQFDTGQFSSGQRTFTIPAGAAAGTVVPFYCTVHLAGMATPNGSITVDPNASAQGNTPTAGATSSGY